ncbi:hypothetical protein EVAR_29004_1 [Eumeta japonica]|uniref:Nucleic-acid-binding protein from transposon X-element n=1 Tax=Eumeta variegata TaxID=151549 RepID=A0A4C1W137_EUMVA|nr:hypothetical protein EVAR_29004_1 [Eumeta japonica]
MSEMSPMMRVLLKSKVGKLVSRGFMPLVSQGLSVYRVKNLRHRPQLPKLPPSQRPLPIDARLSQYCCRSQTRKANKAKAPTTPKVATDEAVIATPTCKKLQKPPPLFIYDKNRWSEIRKQCESKSIVIFNARNTARGLKVQPAAIPNFRNLSALFATVKVAYHTYSLKEEREFCVVLRGVPNAMRCII